MSYVGVAVVAVVGGLWLLSGLFGPGPEGAEAELPRIVVLPFDNLGDPDDEYFAAGMTDEITSRLNRVSGLEVISRRAALRYAGTDKTIREIGEELGVGYILGGNVLWADDSGGMGM